MNYTLESKYYAGCDGTKLAVDLYRPATDEKIPVLIKAGYAPRRSVMELPYERQAIEQFVNAGYAVAIVEVRGSGASFGVRNLYDEENTALVHHVIQALKANFGMKKDVDYVVNENNEIIIVDQFTGRLMPGRQFSEGLHQAIEAKEGVKINEETKTMATITFQNLTK